MRVKGSMFAGLMACFCLAAPVAWSEPAPWRDWEAIGWLERDGLAFCTAALIAPDLALTAAHCLTDKTDGTALPLTEIGFRAGWRNGKAAVWRRVKSVAQHPDYDGFLRSDADPTAIRHDLALLELQLPVARADITPLSVAINTIALREGDPLSLVTAEPGLAPDVRDDCALLSRQDGVLVLSCAVEAGASGAPVLVSRDGEKPIIVSVVSARARADGQPVALGAALEAPLYWVDAPSGIVSTSR